MAAHPDTNPMPPSIAPTRSGLVAYLVVFGMLLAACGSESAALTPEKGEPDQSTTTVSDPASTTTITLAADPSPADTPSGELHIVPAIASDLTGTDLLIAIDARWMCDVQRYAFSDLAAMDSKLDEWLTSHGLSRSEYDAFKSQLDDDSRLEILAQYEALCGGDS